MVPESQVFPLTHHHKITISSPCVSRGLIRVTDRCLEVATADVIILCNGNDSTRETVSPTDQRKVSSD